MDFESPDVEKDFPGLYASESGKKSNESDFSDDTHEKISKKDLLIGKRKDKKDSKKDRGYATLEGESSAEEDSDMRSPSKAKKSKPFKFPSKKEKREKSREKDNKEKEVEKEKDKKKDYEKDKEKKKESKIKLKSSKERRKLKHGDESCDIGEEQPVFGVSLPLALERSRCHDGVEIPLVVRECIIHIEETGLLTEGIYKISGIKSKVQHVRRLYNQRETVNLSDYDLPVATSLLKLFCREMPESILTSKLSSKFEEASGIRDIASRGVELNSLIKQLPSINYHLLSWLIKHLQSVTSHEKQNKMSIQSISQILCTPLQMSQRLLAALIYHADLLFSDIKLIKYIPPLTSSSSNLPVTADDITKELNKQDSLLCQIHSEMNAGYVTKEREELLWEVQRMITQLKRKLRSLEKEAVEVHNTVQYQSISTASGSVTDDNVETAEVKSDHQQINSIAVTCASVVSGTNSIVPNTSVISNTTNTTAISNTTVVISDNCNVTKHVVEAVIEKVNVENDDNEKEISIEENDISPQIQKNIHESGTKIDSHEKSTIDELTLSLETEELLALVSDLQNQLVQEQTLVASLRSEVRSLGGSPSFCNYLLESCSKDINESTRSGEDKLYNNNSGGEEQSSVLRQVKAESHMLQMQKKNLTNSLIEDQESLTRLRIQVKLLSLNCAGSNEVHISSGTGLGISSAIGMSNTASIVSVGDVIQRISSPHGISVEEK